MARRKRESRLPQLTTKAKIIFGLVVFVFVAAIATFVVTSQLSQQLASSGKSYDVQEIKKSLESKDVKDRKTDAVETASSAAQAGDTEKAMVIYEQAITVEKDPTAKVQLAIDEARVLLQQKNYDEAIKVAQQAESYSDDKYLVYNLLGNLYWSTKQYDDAIKYYTLAGKLAGSPTNDTGFTKEFYDTRIQYIKTEQANGK